MLCRIFAIKGNALVWCREEELAWMDFWSMASVQRSVMPH